MKSTKIKQFLNLALSHAEILSKDPSTKVAALFLDREDYTTLSSGFNGMPRGVDESKSYRWERPLKYSFLEHAERNGIYNLARHHFLKGSTAICSEQLTISCIRAFLSVGVKKVYLTKPLSEELLYIASELFNESGVKLVTSETLNAQEMTDFCNKLLMQVNASPEEKCIFFNEDDNRIISEANKEIPSFFSSNPSLVEAYPSEVQESAVRMAIFKLVKPLLKDAALLVTATTCIECARASVLCGIKEIHYIEPSEDFMSRWASSVNLAVDFCKLAGVPTTPWNPSSLK